MVCCVIAASGTLFTLFSVMLQLDLDMFLKSNLSKLTGCAESQCDDLIDPLYAADSPWLADDESLSAQSPQTGLHPTHTAVLPHYYPLPSMIEVQYELPAPPSPLPVCTVPAPPQRKHAKRKPRNNNDKSDVENATAAIEEILTTLSPSSEDFPYLVLGLLEGQVHERLSRLQHNALSRHVAAIAAKHDARAKYTLRKIVFALLPRYVAKHVPRSGVKGKGAIKVDFVHCVLRVTKKQVPEIAERAVNVKQCVVLLMALFEHDRLGILQSPLQLRHKVAREGK